MEKKVVKLPKGHFEIDKNCSTCVYANWNDNTAMDMSIEEMRNCGIPV